MTVKARRPRRPPTPTPDAGQGRDHHQGQGQAGQGQARQGLQGDRHRDVERGRHRQGQGQARRQEARQASSSKDGRAVLKLKAQAQAGQAQDQRKYLGTDDLERSSDDARSCASSADPPAPPSRAPALCRGPRCVSVRDRSPCGPGSTSRKVLPRPSADSTSMRPPWASAIRREMARPSPVPGQGQRLRVARSVERREEMGRGRPRRCRCRCRPR